MNELMKADVFFFVTTIAVALVAILLVILMVYTIKIVRDIKSITKKAKSEADLISQDLDDLRTNVRQQGFKVKFLGNFFNHIYKKHKK